MAGSALVKSPAARDPATPKRDNLRLYRAHARFGADRMIRPSVVGAGAVAAKRASAAAGQV